MGLLHGNVAKAMGLCLALWAMLLRKATRPRGHHKRTAQRIVSTTQTQVHARSAHERTHASGSDVHWRGHHKFTAQRIVSTATLGQASNTHDVQAHCTCLHLCAPKRMQKKSPNFTHRTEAASSMRKVWDFFHARTFCASFLYVGFASLPLSLSLFRFHLSRGQPYFCVVLN